MSTAPAPAPAVPAAALAAVRARRVAIVVNLVRRMAVVVANVVSAVRSLDEVFHSPCLKPAHNATALLLQALGALDVVDLVVVVNHAFRIAHADGRVMANLADVRQAFADWEGELFLRIQLNLLTDIKQEEMLRKI